MHNMHAGICICAYIYIYIYKYINVHIYINNINASEIKETF